MNKTEMKRIILALACLGAFLGINASTGSGQGETTSKQEETALLQNEPINKQSSSIEQRRTSLRDSILTHISGAKISTKTLLIKNFGAKNDGKTDCRAAFAKAIKKASAMKGGKIVVPEGVYYIKGPIVLQSNVCIELQKGATLKFAPEAKYYPMTNTSWEGTFLYNYSPLIYAYGAKNVSIIGEGTIDGNAMTTFATWKPNQKKAQLLSRKMNHEEVPVEQRKFGDGYWLRPQLVQLYNCQGITLEGVKIINSPFWCIHLLKSENIICRNLRYDAKLINNDGIDPECSRNILIEGVEFNNGDDNVAIKSGRDNDGWNAHSPSENIIIRNCHFKGLHAVVIGSEMSSGVKNVIVENCDYAGYCKRGIFIKTNPDRGGFVENVFVKNCTFGDVEDLFYVTSRYAGEGQDNNHFSTVRNIFVDGLKCNNVSAAALVLQGTEAKPVTNVSFDHIEVANAKTGISFENVKDVNMGECLIGKKAGTPTQDTPQDKVFDRDKK